MLLNFLPKSDNFLLNDWKTILDQFFPKKMICFRNKFIWTQWCTFHESAGRFRQDITNFHLSCENVFAMDFFSVENSAKSHSGSVASSFDNRADIFPSKFDLSNFFQKFRLNFERNYQTFEYFFRKEKISLINFLWTDQTHFWQSVGDSSPKYDNSPLKSRKKLKNVSYFKKNIFPQNIHMGTGTPFWLSCQENDKKTKNPLKVWIELFIGFFFARTCVSSKGPYGSAESSFDNCAHSFLPNFDFSLRKVKNCARIQRKVTKLFSFPGKNFHEEKLL